MIFTIEEHSIPTNEEVSFFEHLPPKIKKAIFSLLFPSGDNSISPSVNDLKVIIGHGNEMIMQTAEDEGENAIENATKKVLKLLVPNITDLCKAKGILIIFEVNADNSMLGACEAMRILDSLCSSNQDIIFGMTCDTSFSLEYAKVTIIATGYEGKVNPTNN